MVEKLLRKIARNLDKAGIPYMVIGGQAVLLYGTPRLTRDIDITLGIDADKFPLLKKICTVSGLKILPAKPAVFAEDTNVLPVKETKTDIRVDFIFSFTPYEAQALRRVKKILVGGCRVKFASPEDVLVHKMFAGRAIDEEDARNILIKNKGKLDFKYIKKWLLEFSSLPGQEKLRERWKKVMSSR